MTSAHYLGNNLKAKNVHSTSVGKAIRIDTTPELAAVFRVYGDNILECEHFADWIRKASVSKFEFRQEYGTVDRPILIFEDTLADRQRVAFQLCPYFGGTGSEVLWDHNPLQNIFDEKIDVIVTRVQDDGIESAPVFAIEFVDALMAGNQGWQRFRRAINAAAAGVSYMYVQPIIGWERDPDGLSLRNPRFLTATTCLGQLTLCSKFGVPSLQIYTQSSWSEYASQRGYALPANFRNFGGVDNAIRFACNLIRLNINESPQARNSLETVLQTIIREMIEVARIYTRFGNSYLPIHHNHPPFRQEDSDAPTVYARAMMEHRPVEGEYALHEIDAEDFARYGSFFYKDAQESTCTSNFQNNVLALLNWKSSKESRYKARYLRAWDIEVASSSSSAELDRLALQNRRSLPLTYKENKSEGCLITNRRALRRILEHAYPNLDSEVLNWTYAEESLSVLPPVFLVPFYGYKPSGDSRPDRGLIPLLWAMFPSLLTREQALVIVYSKHTPANWRSIVESGANELWNSITRTAGALIVDKTGDGIVLRDRSQVRDRIDSYG